jgi:hypothetical protein
MKIPTRPPVYERDVLRACLAYLHLCPGILAWRNNTGAFAVGTGSARRFVRASIKGAPDILGCLPGGGRLLCVEVKRPGRGVATTPSQADFLSRVQARGGLCLVVCSVDELRAGLRLAGYDVP